MQQPRTRPFRVAVRHPFENGSSLGGPPAPASLHLAEYPQHPARCRQAARDVRQRPADDALGHAGLIQVLRDPAAEEGIARAEDQAGVDLRRGPDDAVLEDVPRLVGERLEDLHVDLVDARAVVARLERGELALRERAQRRREREALRERVVERLEHVVRDARADHREQRGGRHRDAELERGRVGLLEGRAALERLHQHGGLPGQHPVDDERGRVVDEHAALAELAGRRPRRSTSVTSSVAGVRTTSTSGRTATGLKKCRPTTRSGCSRPSPIAVTESDEVFVTSRHSGATTRSSAREDLLLHAELLEDGLEDEVAPRVGLHALARGRERAEEPRLALGEAALRREPRELLADRLDRLRRTPRVDVGEHDRNLELAEKERRELRRHQPGADDADALDPPRLGLGEPRRALEAPLDDVERVDRGLGLVPRQELGERVLLGRVALLEAPAGGALDQLERPVRRGRLAVDDVVDAGARLAHDLGDVGEVGLRPGLGSGLDGSDE